jgi:hypothetical protein
VSHGIKLAKIAFDNLVVTVAVVEDFLRHDMVLARNILGREKSRGGQNWRGFVLRSFHWHREQRGATGFKRASPSGVAHPEEKIRATQPAKAKGEKRLVRVALSAVAVEKR